MKTTLYLLLAIAVLLPLGACSDEDDGRDNSLAGSISYHYLSIDILIKKNSDNMLNKSENGMSIRKINDENIQLTLDIPGIDFRICYFNSIPMLVTGSPYNVHFQTEMNGDITIFGERFQDIDFSISGWMKENVLATRTSPAYNNYKCDIKIQFKIGEDNYLINITRAEAGSHEVLT